MYYNEQNKLYHLKMLFAIAKDILIIILEMELFCELKTS